MDRLDDADLSAICRNCKFLVLRDGNDPNGDCHRRAPIVTGGMMSNVETVWPTVNLDDWCGDFERRPD